MNLKLPQPTSIVTRQRCWNVYTIFGLIHTALSAEFEPSAWIEGLKLFVINQPADR